MADNPLSEIVSVRNNKNIAETGGGHNQKGIEFQKNWALLQMFSLEEENVPDFLFLFEAIQDVAILDSAEAPKIIRLHQVKKKDRGEWSWASLTKLHEPTDPSKPGKKRKAKPLTEIANSPVGKLHAAVRAFKTLQSSGRFVSNAGCDLTMADGSNAATSLPVALVSLPPHFHDLLTAALHTLGQSGDPAPDLSRLMLEKVDLPVDDPATFAVGRAHVFLLKRSPRHAGQAQSFVESLLAKLGPLGAKTMTCKSFDEMKAQHGYDRSQFLQALANLETLPDKDFYLNMLLEELQKLGVSFMQIVSIKSAAAGIFRRQVLGSPLEEEPKVVAACDVWLADKEVLEDNLLALFKSGVNHLEAAFPALKQAELQAHFLLRAINKCVVQN